MSDQEEEEHDFQAPVNIPTDVFTRKRRRSIDDNDNYVETEKDRVEASLCTLCQNFWTNNGPHAIVNLRCGHVFGKSCIDQHIRESTMKTSIARCPVCDQIVTKSEPRRIWPNKIIPYDEQDMRSIKQQHKEADKTIEELISTLAILKMDMDTVTNELNELQPEDMLKQSIAQREALLKAAPVEKLQPKGLFIYQRTFSLPNEKYRIMDMNPAEDMAVLSVHKKQNQTQPFGFRKLNLYDPSLTDFIPVHSGQIKDVKQAFNNMILSTGLDKTLKLTSLSTKQVVQSYQIDAPGWSCATDPENPNIIYCGLTNNTVLVFDIRNTKDSIHKLIEPCTPRVFSPIHSMSVVNNEGSSSTILCSNLVHSYCWKTGVNNNNNQYKYELLEQYTQCLLDKTDIYKSFTMDYNDNTLFTSLRNKKSTRYEISHFESANLKLDWYYDDLNHKQTTLTRHAYFRRQEQAFICFSDNDTVRIRNKEKQVQEIKANGPIVDIKHFKQDDNEILAVLTEDELQTYKFA